MSAGLETLKRLAAAGGFQLSVTLVPEPTYDAVVDAYRAGVDQTLLIEQLRKTPQQRLDDLISAERTVAEFQRAG